MPVLAVRIIAGFGIAVGCLVIAGWQMENTFLKSISPAWVSMKPNTAIGILLIGTSLLLLSGGKVKWRERIGTAAATAAGIIGLLTLAQYVFSLNFGIDQLLFRDVPTTAYPGRMSPFTSIAFVLQTCSLLMLKYRPVAAQWIAVAVVFASLHTAIGYLYGVEEFYGIASMTQTAVHTAVAMAVLAAGVFLARTDCGPANFLVNNNLGATLFRRLWFPTVALVIGMGYVRLKGEKLGWFGAEYATGVFAIAMIVLLSIILWRNVHRIERADTERRRREYELRDFIENAPFGLGYLSVDGVILQVNRTECDMLGYRAEDLVGRSFADLHADPALAAEFLNRCRRGEIIRDYEVKLQRKDGGIVHVLVDANIKREPGRPTMIAKSSHDITARRNAEMALDTRQRQQEALATIGNFAAYHSDLQAVFDFAANVVAQSLNVEFSKVLRLTEDKDQLLLVSGVGWKEGLIGTAKIPGKSFSQAGYTLKTGKPVIVDDLRTETRFKGPSLLVEHSVISGISVCILHGEDQYGVLGAHTTHLRSFSNEDANFLQAAAHILGSAIRGDEEKRLRKQTGVLTRRSEELETEVAKRTVELQKTVSFLEGFLYSIAHDLRAPLRGMQGFAIALREDYADKLDATGKDYTDRIVSSCMRMDKLVLDLLDYGRLSHMSVPQDRIEVDTVIHEVLGGLAPEVTRSRSQIDIVTPMPIVMSNATVLAQVLTNLISNAIKFVPKSRTPLVRISADVCGDGKSVRIKVEDNGIGIDREMQQRIFRPFERLHTIEEYPGTGIGLAIVQKGVERIGGRIGVESAIGKGTCFWLELPLAVQRFEQPQDEVSQHDGHVLADVMI